MDFDFLTLREKEKKLKVHVNQLEKFVEESELEPNFWFLPCQIACYSNLLASIYSIVDLLHFMVVQIEYLVVELQSCGVAWTELQEHSNEPIFFRVVGVSNIQFRTV